MAFERMAFTPETGLKDTKVFEATPINEEAAREQFQRLLDQIKEQVNALMAALEAETASANIGSAAPSHLDGGGSTVASQMEALSVKLHEAVAGELNLSSVIGEGAIIAGMLASGAVTADKLGDSSVTAGKLADGAVLPAKLGEMTSVPLKNRPDVGATARDTLAYNAETKKLMLSVAGLTAAQLAPVVYGTGATITGSYPSGTIYVQYA